jgi:hypothetical protein
VRVHASALKHGVEPDDAIRAASDPVFVSDLDEDRPGRQFRLGFDGAGRLPELVVLRFASGNELTIEQVEVLTTRLRGLSGCCGLGSGPSWVGVQIGGPLER